MSMHREGSVSTRSSSTPLRLRLRPNEARVLAIGVVFLLVSSFLVAFAPEVRAADPPTVTVGPTSGVVGSAITVGGSGFPASTTVEITFNDSYVSSDVLCATCGVSSGGTFSDSFTVPAATNGTATIAAFESGASASAAFTVVSSQTLTPLTGPPGTTIPVAGNGFDPFSLLTFTFGAVIPTGTCNHLTTSVVGGFACDFHVPHLPYGTYPVTASDDGTNLATNTVEFSLVPGGTATPGTGFVGSAILVSVDGFPAYAPLEIIWDPGLPTQTVLASPLTNGLGEATTSVTVPVAVHGSHTLQVFYSSTVFENFTFVVVGSLTLTPAAGYVGEVGVSAVGKGLLAASTVNLLWDSGTAVQSSLGNVTTLANGTFSLPFTVPSATHGAHHLSAMISGVAMANATFTIDVSNLSLSPTTGPPGGAFTATLTGFAGTSASNVIWDLGLLTQSLLGNATTSDRGALTLSGLHVPSTAAPGPHVVTATDASGDTASATFTVGPWLTLKPNTGPVGSSFEANGLTFPSGHAILLHWNSTSGPVLATIPALSGAAGYPYGNFTATVTVPVAPFGTYTVYAAVSGTSTTAAANFSVIPSLSLSVTKGPVGTLVTATAEGLAADNLSTLFIGGVATGLGAISNALGVAVFPFAMPPEPAGVHALTVADALGHTTNVVNFTVVPSIAAIPAMGYPGEPITVNLTGFAALSEATLAWDGNGTATRAPTAADGSALDVTFVIPSSATPGEHNLSAWDLASNVAPAIPIEVLPLAIPVPVSPPNGAFLNHSVVALAWSPVPMGGVNYTVEIADTLNFSSGAVTVTGISATTWTTPRLPDGTYYWRVEAVAPGGGTAGFSATVSFLVDTVAPYSTVGSLPATVVGLDLSIPYVATDPAPGSGVAGVELFYSLDGGHDWSPYENGTLFTTSPIFFHAPVPGTYEFQTVAVDRAGNHQARSAAGQATVVFEPLAVSPNYTAYVFVITLAVLGVIGLLLLRRQRREKKPTGAPRPWTETKPPEPTKVESPPPSNEKTGGAA